MAFKIVWTERASEDLGAIVRYIARHNPDAAASMGYGILDRADILCEFPEAGGVLPEFHDPAWRQLIYRAYRIVYRVNRDSESIEIVRVWHAARGKPEV